MQDSVKLPGGLCRIIKDYQRGGVSPGICGRCPSLCCSQGGFAILENVILIFGRYQRGDLIRSGFKFEPGLGFFEFVLTYFDVWTRDIAGKPLVMFHMKCLGPEGNLVSIPEAGDYWETREKLFTLNPWMSRGCIFLSEELPAWMEDEKGCPRHCILHSAQSGTHVTAKPIDCVFHTCISKLKAKRPDSRTMKKWFHAISQHFPASGPRFHKMTRNGR